MAGLELLKAFAKQRGVRTSHCMIRDENFPELLIAQTRLLVEGVRCVVRVSPGFLAIRARATTRLVFSIGDHDKIHYRRKLTFEALPGVAGYSYRPEQLEDAQRWLGDARHARLIADLLVEPGDTVHVRSDEIKFHGRVREIGPILSRVLAVAHAVDVAHVSDAAPVDVSMLPQELGAFVHAFEYLADDDDGEREELRRRLKPSERTALLRAAKPLFPALNGYLRELADPWPDAAIKLGRLGELVSEIMIDQVDPARSTDL